jgi:hypothetical protein
VGEASIGGNGNEEHRKRAARISTAQKAGRSRAGNRKFPRPARLAIMIGVPIALWAVVYIVARELF